MSIPGGITIPSDARTDYKIGTSLPNLIAQVIDSLSFANTSEPDIDFKAQPRGRTPELERSREEQRNRINTKYGALTQPSHEYVQRELLFLYRGEASSVDLAKESNGKEKSVIDTASDDAVRTLKKEMKQKIHEWEGSYRAGNGREAGPQDKASLRPVYEVYKVAKNRITPGEGLPPSVPVANASTDSRPSSAKVPSHQPQQPAQPAPPTTAPGRPAIPGVPNTSTTAAPAPVTNPLVPSTAAPTTAAPPPLARRLSQEEATIEKRKLKRKLHQFESDFEKKNGKAPQREDRKDLSGDYARYAELKALLNER